MNETKVRALLGMARKAGKVAMGSEAVESSILRRRAHLVLVDDGASKNTKNRFLGMSEEYKVPAMGLPGGMLSDIYKWEKLYLLSVQDEGFARAIDRAIREKLPTDGAKNSEK